MVTFIITILSVVIQKNKPGEGLTLNRACYKSDASKNTKVIVPLFRKGEKRGITKCVLIEEVIFIHTAIGISIID